MAYYRRYATKKKGVMLGFSMLQLVTSEPKVVAIPKDQPKLSLPCSFWDPATRHGIASVYLAPTRHDLPSITIMIHPGVSQRIPPLFHHVMDSHSSSYTSWLIWPIKYSASQTMHWSSSLLRSFHLWRCFPSRPCEKGIIPTSVACLSKDNLPQNKRFLCSSYHDLLLLDQGILYRFSLRGFSSPLNLGIGFL
jgi:hypothetical protein